MNDSDSFNRLFVVCGRAIEVEALQHTFQQYGSLQQIRLIKEKGVAYVTFSKASSAALAIESLHEAVLNNGYGPKLKVMLADAPNARHNTSPIVQPLTSTDPDNLPPRSRLFIVVPKHADEQQIQVHMGRYPHLEACKTDMVASKGIAFCKFDRASAALAALEDINMTGMLAGYKVKCMLAKPKVKFQVDTSPSAGNIAQASQLGLTYFGGSAASPGMAAGPSAHPGFYGQASQPVDRYGVLSQSFQSTQSGLESLSPGFTGNPLGVMGMSDQLGSPATPHNVYHSQDGNRKRLFVVVHKGASEEMISRLFRRFPGMEYCDLKRDHASGKSKGFCFVNYSSSQVAAAAVEQLHGTEFPPHSGHRIKVLYAEPLAVRHSRVFEPMQMSPSTVQTPPSGMSSGIQTVGQPASYLGPVLMSPTDVRDSTARLPARKLFDHTSS